MSKLHNTLAELNLPPGGGEVPPNVRVEVTRNSEKNRATRKYIICTAIIVCATLMGFGIRLYFGNTGMLASRSLQPLPPRTAETSPETPQSVATVAGQTTEKPDDASPPVIQQPARLIRAPAKHQKTSTGERKQHSEHKPESPEKTAAGQHQAVVPPKPAEAAVAAQATVVDKDARNANIIAARSAERRKAYSEALWFYKKALGYDNANPSLMNNAASMHLRLGEHSAALALTDKALQLEPDYVPALINQGIARSAVNNSSGAAESFAKALAVEPSNREALFNLALFNEKNGDLDVAAATFQRLAANGDVQGMIGIGRIYEKRAQNHEAIKIYSEIATKRDIPVDVKNSAIERLRQLRN